MIIDNRVAIFVDAENLTQWIKQEGLEALFEELSSLGTIVTRKAYARWTNASVAAHQSTLNRLGFELIHTFHPINGKNSADIQIAVDVMDYAGRDDLQTIVLATGDSDFSPLFRRLREKGKKVIGAGPRSSLSESVKSSCSRFFYTDTKKNDKNQEEAIRASAFDDAVDVLEASLKTFNGPANCSALKNSMLNIDSAFDEKALGYKNFTDFVRAVDGVKLNQEGNLWFAYFDDSENKNIKSSKYQKDTVKKDFDSVENYRSILRKKHWRSIPVNVLVNCIKSIQSLPPLTRPEIREMVINNYIGQITSTDVNKAMALLIKSGNLARSNINEEGEFVWKVSPVSLEEILWSIDRAMTVRLISGLQEEKVRLNKKYLSPLLLSDQEKIEIDKLLTEANDKIQNFNNLED